MINRDMTGMTLSALWVYTYSLHLTDKTKKNDDIGQNGQMISFPVAVITRYIHFKNNTDTNTEWTKMN